MIGSGIIKLSVKNIIKQFKLELFTQISVTILISFLTILSPYIESLLVNNIVYYKISKEFYISIIILFFIAILQLLFSYFTARVQFFKIDKMNVFVINQIINKLFLSNTVDVKKHDSTYLHSRLTEDVQGVFSFCFITLPSLISSLVTFICISVFLLIFSVKVFFAFLIFMFFYVIIYLITKRRLYESSFRVKEDSAKFFSNRNGIIERYISIKSKQNEHFELEREKAFAEKMFSSMKINFKWNYLLSTSKISLTLIFQVFFFLIGGYFIIKGIWKIGTFTFITQYFTMIIGVLDIFFSSAIKFQEFMASVNRIENITLIPNDKEGTKTIKDINKVIIKDLNIQKYGSNSYMYSKNLNYSLTEGNVYSIVGENGFGKTTLILNIVGIIKNHTGQIFINNDDINNLNMRITRKNNISIMLQNEIYEDIKVKDYIKKFNLNRDDSFWLGYFNIQRFYQKNIKDLSGGERQLISIYVTLMKKDISLLILDEPFSNLSYKLVYPILNYIKNYSQKNKLITIIISHDNKVIQHTKNINLERE